MKGDRGMNDIGACNGVIDFPGLLAFWRVNGHSPWFPVRNSGERSLQDR